MEKGGEDLEEVYANDKVRKRSHSPISENPTQHPQRNQRNGFVNVWSFSGQNGGNESNARNGSNVKVMENGLELGGFQKCLKEGKPAPT